MDQAALERTQHQLEERAKKLFPGAVRRVALLQHGDDPLVEPGELLLRLVAIQAPDEHGELPDADTVLSRPAMNQFRRELAQRLPEVRRIDIPFEDTSGHPLEAHLEMLLEEETRHADSDFTPVMARLRTAELEIVDTLISAGIAPNRAEAVRWALGRISERPAYAQLRQHTRDIERLKTEF